MSLVSILPGAARAIAAVAVPAGNAAVGLTGSFASLLASASQTETEQPAPATSSHRLAAQQRIAGSLTDTGNPIDLHDLRLRADEALLSLDSELRQRIREAGIDPGTEISFRLSLGDGKITVSGDHPQQQAIEELLNDDSPLAGALREIASTLDLLRAADEHREFAESYEQDPLAALQRYSHLFDDAQAPVAEFLLDAFDVRATLV